jgi:hypothetical protein
MAHEGFRGAEINFLQEQNRDVLESLERVERERDSALTIVQDWEEKDRQLSDELQVVRNKIQVLNDEIQQGKTEVIAKDEHIRVLSEQNKQMLDLLEIEETKTKEKTQETVVLSQQNKKLKQIADEFEHAKEAIAKQVAEAKDQAMALIEQVRNQRHLNETLRADIANTEAQSKVDIEALEQALKVVNARNMEYITRINKQETKEQGLQSEVETLREETENLRNDINELKRQLEGDEDDQKDFEKNKGNVQQQIEATEAQIDALKKALSSAERANEHLQQENRQSAERYRETADKVYALMDSLRLNQVELKKQEAENTVKDKKINSLEKQAQNCQAKISLEMDAKTVAEQEKREAEQESGLLKKKNRKVEESISVSQKATEKAEAEIQDLNEKINALQTQNAYLASRIDAQEEEKNSLKAELKKESDRLADLTRNNTQLRDGIEKLDEILKNSKSDKAQLTAELEYIKREDVLDDTGRQRPILIQSTESNLIERLQINEFLFEAQQARNPVPPMVEKVAQMLELLHTGQSQADQYLNDLSRSNSLLSALRQKNMILFEKTQMFESFKTRALLKYVMNLTEAGTCSDLHLDGLAFGPREISEMLSLMQRYKATDQVFVLSLVDNGLEDESMNIILQMMFAFPYLRSLDLRKNYFTNDAIRQLESQVRTMEGITGVIKTANMEVNVHSGNQLRLCIQVGEQMAGKPGQMAMEFEADKKLNHDEADPFLTSPSGITRPAALQAPQTSQMAVSDPAAADAVGMGTSGKVRKPGGMQPGAMGDEPQVGGVPVGLGGPGDVSSLGRDKKGRDSTLPSVGKPKPGRRSKAPPPPPVVERIPNQKVVDKWQAGTYAVGAYPNRPSSASSRRSLMSDVRSISDRSDRSDGSGRSPMQHSSSAPALRKLPKK